MRSWVTPSCTPECWICISQRRVSLQNVTVLIHTNATQHVWNPIYYVYIMHTHMRALYNVCEHHCSHHQSHWIGVIIHYYAIMCNNYTIAYCVFHAVQCKIYTMYVNITVVTSDSPPITLNRSNNSLLCHYVCYCLLCVPCSAMQALYNVCEHHCCHQWLTTNHIE